MFKYFISGLFCLLVGIQLYFIAEGLRVSQAPAVLIVILSVVLMLVPFVISVKKVEK